MENIYKTARLAAGLTKRQAAEIMLIPYDTIHNWELGRRVPPDYVKRWYLQELEQLAITRAMA